MLSSFPWYPRMPRLRTALCAALLSAAAAAGPARAQSGFYAEYPEVQDAQYAGVRASMMETRQLENFSRWMNQWLRMPRRVALRMAECPTSDVRWAPDQRAVEICYRTGTRLAGLLQADTLHNAFAPAMWFLQLHAVAHAAIDELNLQVGPREEQAVDEFTALLLMRFGPQGARDVLKGITTLQRADPSWAEWDFAESHGLTAARVQSIACMVYGMNTTHFAPVRQAGLIPAARVSTCSAAGQRVLGTWGSRLGNRLN